MQMNIQPDNNDDEEILTVHTEEQNGVPTVIAEGDVDLCTAPNLRQELVAVCSSVTGPTTVAVDMRKVFFIDSAGLALLVEMRKRFSNTCNLGLIVEKGSQPERVLRLGRFDTFLRVTHSHEELSAASA